MTFAPAVACFRPTGVPSFSANLPSLPPSLALPLPQTSAPPCPPACQEPDVFHSLRPGLFKRVALPQATLPCYSQDNGSPESGIDCDFPVQSISKFASSALNEGDANVVAGRRERVAMDFLKRMFMPQEAVADLLDVYANLEYLGHDTPRGEKWSSWAGYNTAHYVSACDWVRKNPLLWSGWIPEYLLRQIECEKVFYSCATMFHLVYLSIHPALRPVTAAPPPGQPIPVQGEYYVRTVNERTGQIKESCEYCDAGTYCPNKENKLPCPVGTFSHRGESECSRCPPGRFGDTEGAAACAECPKGQYQPEKGSVDCPDRCPPGYICPQPAIRQKCSGEREGDAVRVGAYKLRLTPLAHAPFRRGSLRLPLGERLPKPLFRPTRHRDSRQRRLLL